MLVAAAVCPCPPLLVPDVAGGAAHEMDAARAACYDALGVLAASRPDRLIALGPAPVPARGTHPQGARGSFRGYGVDLDVSLGKGDPATRDLPSSLAVAAWLLERTDFTAAPVEGLGVGEPLARDRCAAVGGELAASAERVALLVMGDGTDCRTLKAPGYFDERAAAFDADAARALGAADAGGLLALDEELAYELNASGRSSWQILAGAATGGKIPDGAAPDGGTFRGKASDGKASVGKTSEGKTAGGEAGTWAAGGGGLTGQLLYDEAPYGVGYLVASWS